MVAMDGEVKPTISEILSALSHALDITEGQPRGHAVRTCLLASRVGKTMGLDEESLESLFYAALLKDAGSAAGANRISRLFGDHHASEWSDNRLGGRLKRLLGVKVPSPEVVDELTATRCYRGQDIVRQLGFNAATTEAIFCLDEHWDGTGGPGQLQGDQIPLLSRILGLCQTLELFITSYGLEEAYSVMESRSGRWFDPAVVQVVRAMKSETRTWEAYTKFSQPNAPVLLPPKGAEAATEAGLDEICEAFALIVDSKSSFTGEHSTRVMRLAVAGGEQLGVRDLATLRRAALLHDIGKLGVPSSILDKNGPLDAAEWAVVREHPKHSFEILGRIRGFRRISEIASAHHERLDGSGYWRGLSGDDLDTEMRILACADVFDALTAERPYRSSMALPDAYRIMKGDPGLDQGCVEAVWTAAAQDRSLFVMAAV